MPWSSWHGLHGIICTQHFVLFDTSGPLESSAFFQSQSRLFFLDNLVLQVKRSSKVRKFGWGWALFDSFMLALKTEPLGLSSRAKPSLPAFFPATFYSSVHFWPILRKAECGLPKVIRHVTSLWWRVCAAKVVSCSLSRWTIRFGFGGSFRRSCEVDDFCYF